MADLMAISSSYKLLSAKYGNFIVPALKVKINGVDVVKTGKLVVEEAAVHLSVRAAGSVVLKLVGLYDEKSHSFRSGVMDKFRPGVVAEVELGYLSSTQKVFKGYVAMVGAEFGETHRLLVTLMDARRLMMISGKKHMMHQVKNYSDAVRTVLGNYSRLCAPKIDATSDSLSEPVSQTTSDYDFIMKELIQRGRVDREFFIVAGDAYFRKPKKAAAPMMTVRYGRELQELKVDFSYLDLELEVDGCQAGSQTPVRAKKKAKGFLSQSALFSKPPIYNCAFPDADSQEKAKIRADALARVQEDKACVGRGIAIGLPEIVPGRFLKVEALESMVNHSFYITEVSHVMSKDSFLTYFTIGGVK